MDADGKRKQVSFEQLNALLEFLKEHQELAKGLARGRRGKFHTLKIWKLCAKKMNALKDGAIKDGKGWSKYWCDWKYRVRRRALELKAAKDSNRSLDSIVPLSAMEIAILGIIGVNAVEGVVIKSDPLADGDSDEDEIEFNGNPDDDTSTNQYGTQARLTRGRKRQHSTTKQNILDLDDHCGPSSPLEKKPKVCSEENGVSDDSDNDEAAEFLRLEKEKLENSKRKLESLKTISSEITRLADIMGHIRDILVNNRLNV